MANTPQRQIRRGEIYWIAPVSPTGSLPAIAHPHVVVQDDVFNESRIETTIVCGITSNRRRASEPGTVQLDAGEGGLGRHSVVLASQISSVRKSELGAYIGTLSEQRVNQIVAALRFVHRGFLEGR